MSETERFKFVQSIIANLKGELMTQIWNEPSPTKRRSLRLAYEPRIKKWAYELEELRRKINAR